MGLAVEPECRGREAEGDTGLTGVEAFSETPLL